MVRLGRRRVSGAAGESEAVLRRIGRCAREYRAPRREWGRINTLTLGGACRVSQICGGESDN